MAVHRLSPEDSRNDFAQMDCGIEEFAGASEADPSSKSAAASPAQQEEDAIGNRGPLINPPLAAPSDASAYVKAVFEGFAVRQERLRASNDSQALAASNRNSRMLMDALKGHL